MSQGFERALSPSERLGLRVHLLICRGCRRFAVQLRFLQGALRRLEHEHQKRAAAGLSPVAREKIRRTLGR